ncbi:MAG: TlpA disulfide reductase family protein [Actinomycetota bacterium]|nr:TlpA disulfide reductase family protein [Actinomycetota bacterium]
MKVRTRLLAGSLAVAAVLSLAIGWAIARVGNDDDGDTGDSARPTFDVPSIETNAVVRGKPLPSVNVQLLDGSSIDVASLAGQPLVINVWGSTCGPCKQELPDFAAAHLTYGDQVRFVGIDYLAPSAREEAFARDRGVQYELLYDGNGEFITAVGIAAFPVTLVVDADGFVVRQTGQLDEATLAQYIESDLL